MKPHLLLFFVWFALAISSCSSTEHTEEKKDPYVLKIEETRLDKDVEFSDPTLSPIPEGEEAKAFKGLSYFRIDKSYRVMADLRLTPEADTFEMPSTGERADIYKEYGVATFELDDRICTLHIYQNQRLVEMEEYKDHLFLLFKDQTNGEETYGGGRYIDLKIPDADSIELDFNLAYNPYCSYNSRYSCPIPPLENHLEVSIKAGEKAYMPDDH